MQATSQAFQITPENATSALTALRPERSQFLKKLAQMLLRMAREQGSAALCDSLSLPEFVLKVINGETLVQPPVKRGRSGAPLPPEYQSAADYPVMDYCQQIGGGDYSTQASYYGGGDYADDPAMDDLPQSSFDTPAFYNQGPVQQIQAKVKAMYDTGMDIRLIQALFAIPPVLVHSWGDFTRSKKAEKLRRLKRIITEKMNHGDDLCEAVKGLRMTKLHAEHILGLCEEMAAARTISDDKRYEVIEEAKKAPRPGNTARKYGIPKMTIHRWLRGDFTHNDGESAYVAGDSLGSAPLKRRCLESFYLSKRDLSRTAATTGVNEETLMRIVEDFETRVANRVPRDEEDFA